MTKDTVIQRVKANPFAYDIVLFNQRFVSNLANVCCTDNRNLKSILSWDLTFDLGKSPPFYVLALSYGNISLINKTTGKSNVMLEPVLVCHKKDEKAIKLLCDTLLDVWPGQAENLSVLGADGEMSVLNQTCNAFPFAVLLLCIRHIGEKREIGINRNQVMTAIFGNNSKKGLADSQSIEEFETEVKYQV